MQNNKTINCFISECFFCIKVLLRRKENKDKKATDRDNIQAGIAIF